MRAGCRQGAWAGWSGKARSVAASLLPRCSRWAPGLSPRHHRVALGRPSQRQPLPLLPLFPSWREVEPRSSAACREASEAQRRGGIHPRPSEPADSRLGAVHSQRLMPLGLPLRSLGQEVQHPGQLPEAVGPLGCPASQGPLQGGQLAGSVVQSSSWGQTSSWWLPAGCLLGKDEEMGELRLRGV